FAEHAVRKLHERFPRDSDDVRNWPECWKLIDHVLNAATLAQESGVALDSTATLLSNAGVYYQSVHDLTRAVSLHERSWKIQESAQGLDHPTVAKILNYLANDLLLREDLAEARSYLERALRINEAAYGPDHPEVALTLNSLGLVARDQGNLAEARRYLERSL